MVSREFAEFCASNAEALDAMVVEERDFDFDYFGYKTLAKSYLLKTHEGILERP